jgi:hypothetical protein
MELWDDTEGDGDDLIGQIIYKTRLQELKDEVRTPSL